MKSQWDDWLRELAAQQMGGRDWVLPAITPGYAWTHILSVQSDVSADAFAADVLLNPDADTALVSMTVTVGAYADGATPVTLALTSANVTTITDAASDDDFDGLAEAVVNLFHTPSGGDPYRAAATNIVIVE